MKKAIITYSHQFMMRISVLLTAIALLMSVCHAQEPNQWELGSFERSEANPILTACAESRFHCPMQNQEVQWEVDQIFNPGAVVRNGKVYLIYRSEDNYGMGIGMHTSRLGLAESDDGIHFRRNANPVLFPTHDDQSAYEWPGGCEDPRVVEKEDGSYIMTYTQWNREIAVLAIASSQDLLHWKKHGYAFDRANGGAFGRRWSKSGSIVCRREGDRLIATKIQGKYWMYWGEGCINIALSDDLISWEPLLDEMGQPIALVEPRPGKFDSELAEVGPPAIITQKGIVLLYNGKNSAEKGDPKISKGAYAAGQLLFDRRDPTRLLAQTQDCFFKPEKPYEMKGQYQDGTVFIQGLVRFQGNWLLYYGGADSSIGVAISKD